MNSCSTESVSHFNLVKADLSPDTADMVILGRRRFNARHLTSVVQSAASLKFDDEGLMDKISQNLLTRMDKLDNIEVTDLVGSSQAPLHQQVLSLYHLQQALAHAISLSLCCELA